MRRAICTCEPNSTLAGELNTWNFTYTTAASLPKGTKVKFDIASEGRIIDWEIPDTNLKAGSNIIYAMTKSGKPIQMKEVSKPGSFIPDFEFQLSEKLAAGEKLTIVMGAPPKAKGKALIEKGSQSQVFTQRRKPFYLYVDTSGKGRYDEPEVFMIDVRGNHLHHIRVYTPSFVERNKRFDVIVRFEDEFGNLTNNAPEDTLVELTHEHLRENLNWKLFLPETGYLTLPNLYFSDVGTYTLQLTNLKTKDQFRSSPIRCFHEQPKHLLFGTLHGESDRFDTILHTENCFRYFRDALQHKFYATSPFESDEETTSDAWKQIVAQVPEFDEEDRFTPLLGFQWEGKPKVEGTRLFIYGKENKTLLRTGDSKYGSLKKIYQSFSPKELISIPTFTMGKGHEFDFAQHNPEFERVVEIYNAWGSSECTAKAGNPCPIKGKGKKGISESKEGDIQKALNENCRFGFVAGGLDDRGIYSELFESGQTQYPPGLTAIIAPTHTRNGVIEALHNRSCYATTGERIVIGVEIAGATMGQELSTGDKPGLMINRHIAGYVAGTDEIATVEIIRNGKVIETIEGDDYHLEFAFDDMNPLDKASLKVKGKEIPFAYYYIRVTQQDGHMAWSSPIWIDINAKKKSK